MAAKSEFPTLIRLGKQAREDGATKATTSLGDVVEALIGALLLDGGLRRPSASSCKIWDADLAEQRKAPQHPKSALQELGRGQGLQGARL